MQKILGSQEHTYNDWKKKKSSEIIHSPLFPEMNVNKVILSFDKRHKV